MEKNILEVCVCVYIYIYLCVCVCLYNWITLLYTRDWHNIVNQL